MRKIIILVAPGIILATVGHGWAEIAATQPSTEPVLKETEPVRVYGLDFQLVAPEVWVTPGEKNETTIPLKLKVTNQSGEAVQLDLLDTLVVQMKDAEGKELQMGSGRKDARPCPPLIVAKDKSGVIDRTATLQRSVEKPGQFRLMGSDGAGGIWFFDGLKPGKYGIRISYNSVKNTQGVQPSKPGDPLVWLSNATTQELTVEIAEASISSNPVSKDGLKVTVMLPKATFAADEALKFIVQFENVSDAPFNLLNVDGYHYREWQLRFKRQGKEEGVWGEFMFNQAGEPKPTVVPLQPGQRLSVLVVMDTTDLKGVARILSDGKQERLKPGQYLLAVKMNLGNNIENDPKPRVKYWTGAITTEPIEFEIADAPATRPVR